VNGRTILALLGAPLAAAVAVSAMALFSMPQTPHAIAPEPVMFLVASLAVAAIFEVLFLLPLWYLLRAATRGARMALWLLGVAAWFAAAVLLGYLLGHGGGVALSFGTTFLLPGIVVTTIFAVLMPPRVDDAPAAGSILAAQDATSDSSMPG
jgi:uncharacterized membrane protein